MKKKKKSRSLLQIKTAVDFGEEGLPLEQLGSLMDSLKRHHETLFVRKRKSGFVPIKFGAYVDLHLKSNPGTDRADFVRRLRDAVDACKKGERCYCGQPIWSIGSAEVGSACFTCITGEAYPESDYEIDEVCPIHLRS
jgi:hypothetical protein